MNKFLLISVCAVGAMGALLVEAHRDKELGGNGHGSGYGAANQYLGGAGEYLGNQYGSQYANQYGMGSEYNQYAGSLGNLANGLTHGLNNGYGSGSGYGSGYGNQYNAGYGSGGYGEHAGYGENLGGHGLGGHHHGAGHQGGARGQVKSLLKQAGRSMLAKNPELGHSVHEIINNPSVRRGMERVKPKLENLARQARPYLHEGAKVAKEKLTDTVNNQNLKQQGFRAAEGAVLY